MQNKSAKILREAEQYAAYAMANLTNEDRILADRMAANANPAAGTGLDEFCRALQALTANFLFPHLSPKDQLLIIDLLYIRSKITGFRKVIQNGGPPEDLYRTDLKIKRYQQRYRQVNGIIEESGMVSRLTPLQRDVLGQIFLDVQGFPAKTNLQGTGHAGTRPTPGTTRPDFP